MHKKIIGILVCMLLFSIAVLPATSKPILESENIDECIGETEVRVFYFCEIDFIGKGEAFHDGAVVTFNLIEGEGTIYALFSHAIDNVG